MSDKKYYIVLKSEIPFVPPTRVKAMLQDALGQPYLCTHATGVLVQAKGECRRAHFWVLVAPELHVLFRYSRRHDSQAVDALLAGYDGYLVAYIHVAYSLGMWICLA